VQHRNSAGVLLDTLNTGQGGFTTGSAFDTAGNFYVTNFSAASVTKFAGPGDPHTASLFGGGYPSSPESIVFAANGNVLVGSVGGGIREFDAAGNFIKTIVAGTRVDFFDLAADQDTIIFGQEGSQILTASRSSGLQTGTFTSSANNAFAMRFLPGGGVLLANGSDVTQFDTTGAIVGTYDVTGAGTFFGLNLAPSGTEFVTATTNGGVFRFAIASGTNNDNQTQSFTTGSGNTFGVAIFGERTDALPPPSGSVPEPGVLVLLGIALGAFGITRRRKKA
jgi:hypothetical protein